MTHLRESGCSSAFGGAARNHKASISFGFSGMSCTDRQKVGFHGLATPRLTTALKGVKSPVVGHESLDYTVRQVLKGMTERHFAVASLLRTVSPSPNVSRNKHFAGSIVDGNIFEGLYVSLSKMAVPTCKEVVDDYLKRRSSSRKGRTRGKKNASSRASSSLQDCSLQGVSLPISGGLSCHTDVQNAKEEGYRGNISQVVYRRSPAEDDHTKPQFLDRLHVGCFGRRVCETRNEFKQGCMNVVAIIDSMMTDFPDFRTCYDPSVVLVPQPGDVATNYQDENLIVQKPHINKSVHYSGVASKIALLVEKRRRCGVPVSLPELAEMVLTSCRWTSSVSAWAKVFDAITTFESVEVTIPAGVTMQPSILKKHQAGRQKLRFDNGHSSPLPHFVMYLWKALEFYGSVAGGCHQRFQTHCSAQQVVLEEEVMSLKNNLTLLLKLIKETKSLEHRPLKSDDELRFFCRAVEHATKDYVEGASKSLASGGVKGFGNLLSHHNLGVLTHMGAVHIAHSLNTNFSRSNGTTEFLMEHGISVSQRREAVGVFERHLRKDVQAYSQAHGKSVTRKGVGVCSQPIAENVVCEAGRATDSPFVETVNVAEDAFLATVKDGQLKACFRDGVTKDVVTSPSEAKPGVLDLSVADDSPHASDRFCYWRADSDLTQYFQSTKFLATSTKAKKREKKRKDSLRQSQSERGKRQNPRNDLVRVVKNEESVFAPQFKWGFQERHVSPRFKTQMRSYAREIIKTALEGELFKSLAPNAHGLTAKESIHLVLERYNVANDKLGEVVKELLEIQLHFDDEEVEPVEPSGGRVNAKELIQMVKTEIEQRRASGRQLSVPTDVYKPEDQRSYNFEYAKFGEGRAVLFPTYTVIKDLPDKHRLFIDVDAKLTAICKSRGAGPVKTLRITADGHTLYKSLVRTAQGDISSSHQLFHASSSSQRLGSFCVGMCKNSLFESKLHAKLALLFVLYKLHNEYIEDIFLWDTDFVVLTPTTARVVHNANGAEVAHAPICAVARLSGGVFAVDLDQLKFNGEHRDVSRRETLSGLRLRPSRSEAMKRVKTTMPDYSERWTRLREARLGGNCACFLEQSLMLSHTQLPLGCQDVEKNPEGLPGWTSFAIMTKRKKEEVVPTRLCRFWLTPRFKVKLRSKRHVEEFQKLMCESEGSERAAVGKFKERCLQGWQTV